MIFFQKILEKIEVMDSFTIERMRFATIIIGVFVFGIALRSAMFSSDPQKGVLAAAQPALIVESVPSTHDDPIHIAPEQSYTITHDNASGTEDNANPSFIEKSDKEIETQTDEEHAPSVFASEPTDMLDAPHTLLADAYIVTKGVMPMEKLYGRNIHERRAPASLTKLMTAVVIIEHTLNDETITITDHAVKTEGVAGYLHAGERLRASDLLKMMLIVSSNDAAAAFADHFAEQGKDLIGLMNTKAKELGMRDTHFVNPSGLDDPDHYSSAFDLALLTSYSLRHEMLWKILYERADTVYSLEENRAHTLVSNNPIIQKRTQGVKGSKTGYTISASGCLVVTMDTGEVIVVLGSENRAQDAEKLITLVRTI